MYSAGRVATNKFGCRVIRRPFVGVLSNDDAVLRVAGGGGGGGGECEDGIAAHPSREQNRARPSRR